MLIAPISGLSLRGISTPSGFNPTRLSRIADQYLADLDAALGRLAEDLSLFKGRHDYTGRLRFHSVREHVLVGDVIGGVGFVLTVWQGSMNFIDRLPNLEPDLLQEAEIMARKIAELDAPGEGA